MKKTFFSVYSLLIISQIVRNSTQMEVEQVHLSLGLDDTSVVATFHSRQLLDNCTLTYLTRRERGAYLAECELDTNLGLFDSVYTYRALLTGLVPGNTYLYQISDYGHDSEIFTYSPWNNSIKSSWAVFGDLGLDDAISFDLLRSHVRENKYSCMFHIGDFAYNLYEYEGELGNSYMKMMEPIVSSLPYQTCAGNHERRHNFTHYDFRFSMIHDRSTDNQQKNINNYYHSFDLGLAHVIMYDTEFYYYPQHRGWHQIREQYEWLEKDLQKANANREAVPWIVVMGHRPLYCFRLREKSCSNLERSKIRRGVQMFDQPDAPLQYGLEDLFYKYGVDIEFSGHEHHYVRTFPLYRNVSQQDLPLDHYEDPLAPVHIITGSAGNEEKHPPVNARAMEQQWAAVHAFDYGFTSVSFDASERLEVRLEQWSAETGKVIDKLRISKRHPAAAWQR